MVTTAPGRSLARVELFNELDWMRRRMGDVFSAFPSRLPFGLFEGETWTPAVDLFHENGDLIVRADLPGVDFQDVKLTLADDVLTIEGVRKLEKKLEEENVYFQETHRGSFLRRIAMPAGIPPDAIKATFKNGVLEVRVPMPKATLPKEIPIKSV